MCNASFCIHNSKNTGGIVNMVKFVLATLFVATLVCIQAQKPPADTRPCEERCAATSCLAVQENCTRNGGAIKLPKPPPGQCACCEICAYTVGRGELCGWKNGAFYECGCNLQCKDGKCKPIKDKNSSESC